MLQSIAPKRARERHAARKWIWQGALLLLPLLSWLLLRLLSSAPAAATAQQIISAQAPARIEPSHGVPVAQALGASNPAAATPADVLPAGDLADVSGRVLDASGGPVVEANVEARSLTGGGLTTIARSDANGRFRIRTTPGLVELSAGAEGYSLDSGRRVEAPAVDVSFVLAPASAISGHVVTAGSGASVAGAVVSARNVNGSNVADRSVQSEADGSFSFAALPAGGYSLTARAPALVGAPHQVNVALADSTESVLLELSPAATLQARVRVHGSACAHGTLQLWGPSAAATDLDAGGTATLEGLLPGPYHVDVACSAGVPHSEELELGAGLVSKVWELERGWSVRGRVETGSHSRVSHASIRVQSSQPAGPGASCVSDDQGEFECGGLPSGEYLCIVQGAEGSSDPVAVSLAEGHSTEGVVLRTRPFATIRVAIDGVDDAAQCPWSVLAHDAEPPAPQLVARAQGSAFVFERLPLGAYRVFVGSETAQSPASNARVELSSEGQLVELHLAPPSSDSLSGRIVDERGTPVPDAWVRAFVAEPILGGTIPAGTAVLSDGDGKFLLPELARGRYDLRVSSDAGEVDRNGVETGTAALLISLPARAALSGSVRGLDDESVATFELSLQAENGPSSVISGRDGAWSLPWLAPGRYLVAARTADAAVSQRIELAPGERRTLDLRLSVRATQPGSEEATVSKGN